jgi:hypothetical protein
MNYLKAFIAGFFSTLIFHQGLLLLLSISGLVPAISYNLKPTEPFGVPSVLSLSFFGGLWGILLWLVVIKNKGAKYWFKSWLFGALAPTIVAIIIIFPLKGIKFSLPIVFLGFILNSFWGIGTGLLMQIELSLPRIYKKNQQAQK